MKRLLLSLIALGLVLQWSACGDGLGIPGSDCRSYRDYASCTAHSACVASGCPSCSGEVAFEGCYAMGDETDLACPPLPCAPGCSAYTDASSCKLHGCDVVSCPSCGDGSGFIGCYEAGKGPIPSCPPCIADCDSITDETQCNAAAGCHARYADMLSCGCFAPGCCTSFDRCVAGPVQCTPTPSGPECQTPFPLCEGPFVVDYDGACAVGCVLATSC